MLGTFKNEYCVSCLEFCFTLNPNGGFSFFFGVCASVGVVSVDYIPRKDRLSLLVGEVVDFGNLLGLFIRLFKDNLFNWIIYNRKVEVN